MSGARAIVDSRQEAGRADVTAAIEHSASRAVTLRSLLFGACVAVAINVLANTIRYVQKGSYMAISVMPMGNLLLWLLSILVVSALAWAFGRRFVFTPAEWITVFCMGLISSIGPTYGISGYLVGLIVSPYYFATPENRWAEYIHPYLPRWLIPTNDTGAMTWFFEGLPRGASVPWDVWAVPLLWWFSLLVALGLACFCVATILHRQWADNEKLVYPLLTPILEISTHAGPGRRALPAFMSGSAFWSGFTVTFFVFGWNTISWFYPAFPKFPMGGNFIWDLLPKGFPPLSFVPSTIVFCFSYFASLDVLFSLWFFDLLYIIEAGTLNRVGVVATSPHYGAGAYVITSYKWKTTGAFVALVLWWLWMSRHHLRNVLHKAIHPEKSSVDDSRELLPYRAAVIGLIVSCLYIAAWLEQVGMEGKMIILVLPTMFIVYIGAAKVVADSGLVYLDPPAIAWDISRFALGGVNGLRATTRATSSLVSFNVNHPRGFALPLLVHINRLGDFVSGAGRRLFWGVFSAYLIGVVVSTLWTVWLSYRLGAHEFRGNFLILYEGLIRYNRAMDTMVDPKALEAIDYWLFLSGIGIMGLLNLMRYRFTWWPFHPVGFALMGTTFTRRESSTILVAWLVKFVTIKLFGAGFYQRTRPFFVGLLVGYVVIVIFGLVIDVIWFPMHGHIIHNWY